MDNNEFKLRFGNNAVIDKEKYLEYSQIVEQEVFNNINDAKNKAIQIKLEDMNNFVSIFVKSGANSPKYIIVSLKDREIAHNLFYEEAMDTSTINVLANHWKNIKTEYNNSKEEASNRIINEEYQNFEGAKEKAKNIIKQDNDLTSVWQKDGKYYVVLSRDRELAFRNNYKEVIKYDELVEEMKQDRNEYFTYKQGDIQFGSSQCDFCKYNDLNNKSVCIKYPNGKPNNIINTEEKCEYLEMEESKNMNNNITFEKAKEMATEEASKHGKIIETIEENDEYWLFKAGFEDGHRDFDDGIGSIYISKVDGSTRGLNLWDMDFTRKFKESAKVIYNYSDNK